MKPYLTPIAAFIAIVFIFLSGCSGSNNSTGVTTTAIAELGRAKGSSVSIQALDGYTLYTVGNTQSDGSIKIDTDYLKSVVDKYDPNIKLVRIVFTGGIDTDPNDDGIFVTSEEKSIAGVVKSIMPLKFIYENNDYRINFITSAIADVLDKAEKIDEAYVLYIAEKMGISDLDQDSVITFKDLVFYDMVQDDSDLENELRTNYLSFFHSGDTVSQTAYIDNMKYSVGYSKPTILTTNNGYTVSFSKINKGSVIKYGITYNEIYPTFNEYFGEALVLTSGGALIYQECDTSNSVELCNNVQKVFFYDTKYSYEYPIEPMSDIAANTQAINDLYASIQNLNASLNQLSASILSKENQLSTINASLNQLNINTASGLL